MFCRKVFVVREDSVQQEKNNKMTQKVMRIMGIIMLLVIGSNLSYAQNEKEIFSYENPQKAATDYYMRGKEMLLTNNVEHACKFFLLALKAVPEHGPSNYELSLLASDDKALEYAMKAYQADTTNYWYQGQLAEIYLNNRNISKAVEMGEKMIKTNATDDKAYKQLATFYFYNNEIDKAMAMVDTISTRFGDTPELAFFHANMIKSLNEPSADMLKVVQDYSVLYDDIPQFALILGEIYIKLGLDAAAITNFKRVRTIDNSDLRGDIALFDYYNVRRNQTEAVKYLASLFKYEDITVDAKIALYNEMIASNVYLYRNYFNYVDDASMSLMLTYPTNMAVRKLYSEHLLRKGDISSALAFNKTGLENGVVDYESLSMILEIEAYFKHIDSMKVYVEKGLELFPEKKTEFNMIKVSIYTMTKEYSKAIDIVNNEIKIEKKDSLLSVYHGIIGDIYHSAGKNTNAYKAYDKSLKYDPANVVVLNNYSYYLTVENKNLEKALTMALMVVNKEPSNSTYIDTYAWVLYKLGRYKEAREVIAKAVALDTTRSSSLVLHYGDILEKLGQRQLAETYWLKAFEYGEDEKEVTTRMNKDDARLKAIKDNMQLK